MAKTNGLEKMSYAELVEAEGQIARLKIEKQNSERTEVRQKLLAMAKQHGFEISDLFGKGGGRTEISRPKEPGEYLDRPRPHAPLDDGRDQGRQVKKGRFPDLISWPGPTVHRRMCGEDMRASTGSARHPQLHRGVLRGCPR